MGQTLPENEKELYQRIDEIIHYLWDTIGIAGEPFAHDEYYAYLPEIFSLAKKKNSEEEIVEYLNDIRVKSMESPSDMKRCKEIALMIVKWSKHLVVCQDNDQKIGI